MFDYCYKNLNKNTFFYNYNFQTLFSARLNLFGPFKRFLKEPNNTTITFMENDDKYKSTCITQFRSILD